MVYSPQDVFARHLVSSRGYPLWTPEPNMNLPEDYVREGLKIGDVGVVVPEDGSFDVFFNVCLPVTHTLHRETGVPNNFSPIPLSDRDISKFPEAERAGCIISSASVTSVRGGIPLGESPESRVQSGPLNYEFTLSSQEGAVLILPEGAERYHLRNEHLFLNEAVQHAVDWYTFAEQRLGRIISHDSLYLISGFHKAPAWSLAARQQSQGAGTRQGPTRFKAVQVARGKGVNFAWETTQAMDWRTGPSDQYYNGMANQTVFIHGFKIAIREDTKWVNAEVDISSVQPNRVELSSGSWLSDLLGGASGDSGGSTAIIPTGTVGPLSMDSIGSDLLSDGSEDVIIERFPHVMKPFHPSDIINQYLLQKVPSATVAVTHDSQWTMLLEKGLLEPEELSQEDHLVSSVVNNYLMVLTHKDAVYLQSIATENDGTKDDDVDAMERQVTSTSRYRASPPRTLPTEHRGTLYWSPAPVHGALPTRKMHAHTVTLIDNVAWLFGGCDDKSCWGDIYCFDTDTMQWSHPDVSGDVPPPCRAHTATLVDRKIVIFGGGRGRAYFNSTYILDTTTRQWFAPTFPAQSQPAEGDPLHPVPRRAHTAVLYDDKIYVFGGGNGIAALNDLWALDVSRLDTSLPNGGLKWTLINTHGDRPSPRGYHTANLVGNIMVIMGGSNGLERRSDIWHLNLDSLMWARVSLTSSHRRYSHTSTLVGSRLFIFGGHNGTAYNSEILVYNLVSFQYEPHAICGKSPSPRGYHVAVMANSKLFVFGGYNGHDVFDDVHILDLAGTAYLPPETNLQIDVK